MPRRAVARTVLECRRIGFAHERAGIGHGGRICLGLSRHLRPLCSPEYAIYCVLADGFTGGACVSSGSDGVHGRISTLGRGGFGLGSALRPSLSGRKSGSLWCIQARTRAAGCTDHRQLPHSFRGLGRGTRRAGDALPTTGLRRDILRYWLFVDIGDCAQSEPGSTRPGTPEFAPA